MVYINPFLRLVLIGTLYNVEDFSFSLNFMTTGTPLPPTEVPGSVVTECQRYFANNAAPLSQNARLTRIKLNAIGVDGRYISDETVEYELSTPVPGGSSSNPAPQLALCVSTTTSVQRGRASKGRYYLPLPGGPVESTGQISVPYTTAAVAEATTFINTLNAALTPWHAGIVSNVGTGAQRRITGLRVGRVLDTMRSRRDKFDEDYRVSGAIPLPSEF